MKTDGNEMTDMNGEIRTGELQPGTVLNEKYRVEKAAGRCALYNMYEGRELDSGRKVMIKELGSREPAALTDAEQLIKLDQSRAVVPVRDCFEENGISYIVMDRIEGVKPGTVIKEKGKPFDTDEMLAYFKPVFETLEEMHRNGLIHCNISPNTVVLENGKARLIDFDLVYHTADAMQKGWGMLNPGFSPIEQVSRHGRIGPWTDVYALAATIYYCLTGKYPPDAVDRIETDGLRLPASAGAKLSRKQERALLKALAVKPEDRYQSLSA